MAVAPKKKTKPSKVSVEAVPEVQAKSLVEIAIEKFSAAKDSMMTQLSPMLSNLFARKTMSPMKFTLPQNILVVGAGGTGGWAAPKLAKIISDALNKRIVEHQVNVVFIDADKENYVEYFKLIKEKIKSGSVVIFDNVLWYGKVLEEEPKQKSTKIIKELNEMIAKDEDFENLILSLRDGVNLIRKK